MRKVCVLISALFICALSGNPLIAQKKIVVMGSSSAAGTGASSPGTSWAGRLTSYFQRNTADGFDTIVYNIAHPSYTTYHEMPGSFVTPPGRPAIDPNCNVTKALSYSPDVVIINLPSNDIVFGFTVNEQMNNLRLMSSAINAVGVKCYISTSQPRNTEDFLRIRLRNLVDSVNNTFGAYAIDFWSDLVSSDGTFRIAQAVSAGDDIHVNDLGHSYLFERVRAKQLFAFDSPLPLPLRLLDFSAREAGNTVSINWKTAEEETDTRFEVERSADGQTFAIKERQNGKGLRQGAVYSWTDENPQPGKNIYRLKITEAGRVTYSLTASVVFKKKDLAIQSLFIDPSANSVVATIFTQKTQPAVVSLISSGGSIVKRQTMQLSSSQKLVLPLSGLAAGTYIFTIQLASGDHVTKSFIKR